MPKSQMPLFPSWVVSYGNQLFTTNINHFLTPRSTEGPVLNPAWHLSQKYLVVSNTCTERTSKLGSRIMGTVVCLMIPRFLPHTKQKVWRFCTSSNPPLRISRDLKSLVVLFRSKRPLRKTKHTSKPLYSRVTRDSWGNKILQTWHDCWIHPFFQLKKKHLQLGITTQIYHVSSF